MSEVLLDTCALIWLGNGDSALSSDALRIIENAADHNIPLYGVKTIK